MGLGSHLFLGRCLCLGTGSHLFLGMCALFGDLLLAHSSPLPFCISPYRPAIRSLHPSSPKQFPLPRKSLSAPSLSSEELRFHLLVSAHMSCLQCDTLISHIRLRPPGQGPMKEQQQKDTDLEGVQFHLPFPQIMWERGP